MRLVAVGQDRTSKFALLAHVHGRVREIDPFREPTYIDAERAPRSPKGMQSCVGRSIRAGRSLVCTPQPARPPCLAKQ